MNDGVNNVPLFSCALMYVHTVCMYESKTRMTIQPGLSTSSYCYLLLGSTSKLRRAKQAARLQYKLLST